MKCFFLTAVCLAVTLPNISWASPQKSSSCWVGAFVADHPTSQDITNFKDQFGKKPYLIMIFTSWNDFLDPKTIADVYTQNSVLMITWEPWIPQTKKGIDYTALIKGQDDAYIIKFAKQIKAIGKPVFLRFAHEVNGNWYPWAGTLMGQQNYIAAYRHVKDVFDHMGVNNVEWVFTVNWQNVPAQNNDWQTYFPGEAYVDYIGIDGYNWGNTQSWSHWMGFQEMFTPVLNEIKADYNKPVLISEFSSTTSGGDRVSWIKGMMQEIRHNARIKGFVLFDVDKEVNWRIDAQKADGQEFKKQLADTYFKSVQE